MKAFPNKDNVLKTVAYCCWTLNRALEIFDCGGLLLTRRHANEASTMMLQHLRAFQFLASEHGIAGAYLFKMRPKSHYLWHTAIQTRTWKINPYMFHCFSEESWLGRCKRIAVQCHGATMQRRILQRYLICLGLYLEQHRRQIRELEKTA